MTKFILVLLLLLTGCVTYTPMPHPAPIPCEVKIKGECREMTAGEKSGAVVRGHEKEVKEIK